MSNLNLDHLDIFKVTYSATIIICKQQNENAACRLKNVLSNKEWTINKQARNVDYFARQSEATVCFVGNGFVFVKTHQNGITVKFSDTFFLKT